MRPGFLGELPLARAAKQAKRSAMRSGWTERGGQRRPAGRPLPAQPREQFETVALRTRSASQLIKLMAADEKARQKAAAIRSAQMTLAIKLGAPKAKPIKHPIAGKMAPKAAPKAAAKATPVAPASKKRGLARFFGWLFAKRKPRGLGEGGQGNALVPLDPADNPFLGYYGDGQGNALVPLDPADNPFLGRFGSYERMGDIYGNQRLGAFEDEFLGGFQDEFEMGGFQDEFEMGGFQDEFEMD